MTIYIENEALAMEELEVSLFEIETWEVSEAIRQACRVDISDLLNEEWN